MGTIARRLTTYATRTIGDTIYTDLVEVVAGLPDVTVVEYYDKTKDWDERALWKFYFSKEHGLISADLARQYFPTSTVRLDFSKRYEAMPIPLTR